ncbi:MAG TPA: amidohydrolase family protein [Pyrinomonadaceae bacterium]|jgi:imidazolonepropionase-like amidohydrolase
MKTPSPLLRAWLSLSLAFVACAASPAGGATPAGRRTRTGGAQVVAFVGVNVVPLDRERVLADQTVVVRDGRITEIGPAGKVKVPAGAGRVDGRGKYLMPGLADMHAHLHPGDGSANDLAAQQLTLYLANGVTTVRNMIGASAHVLLRERVAAGKLLGPTLYTAGPPVTGKVAATPEAAERIAAAQKQAGYDLVKVHEGLRPEVYQALMAAARKEGIRVAGHVTATVGLRRALAARQSSVEHLDGYLQALAPEDFPAPPSQVVLGPALAHLDERRLPELARATREAGVYNTPTLALFKIVVSSDGPAEFLKWPELRYVPSKMREGFARQKAGIKAGEEPEAERRRYLELRDRAVKALHDAGARLLVGPDSPQLFLVPGFATHREMAAMGEAGLSPYAVLEAATRNAAEYLGAPGEFGTVEVGKRADLVLLDANPLQAVANASRVAGVMARGRWLARAELDRMLEEIAAANH